MTKEELEKAIGEILYDLCNIDGCDLNIDGCDLNEVIKKIGEVEKKIGKEGK